MFENVPRVVTSNDGRDLTTIVAAMNKLGYESAWTLCSATDVDLPQRRTRWFCLCRKQGADLPDIPHYVEPRRRTMPALLAPKTSNYEQRYFMLGNSVVPPAVRIAFHQLSAELSMSKIDPVPRDARQWTIVLDPEHGPHTRPSSKLSTEEITDSYTIRRWPTPRAYAPRACNYLSERNSQDLPTAARFASSVNGKHMDKPRPGETVNIVFVEWLMGFPANWTIGAPEGSVRNGKTRAAL